LACHGSCTSRVRKASDELVDLTLTGTSFADAQFRAAFEGVDGASSTWVAVGTDATITASDVSLETTTYLEDDQKAIKYALTASGTAWAVVDMGEDLTAYSRFSVWLRQNTPTTTEIFFAATSTDAYTNAVATYSVPALTTNRWTNVDIAISGDLTGTLLPTTTYFGIAVTPAGDTSVNTYIDAIRAYDDSITVDIGGNTTSTNNGTPFYLKTTGGAERAVGYYDYFNSGGQRVVLIPSAEIAAGENAVTLKMVTNTTKVMESDTTAAETLSLSMDLGSCTGGTVTAGDFRWYDQLSTSPITWLNGASPISQSLSY